jgi:hypothetical protein
VTKSATIARTDGAGDKYASNPARKQLQIAVSRASKR